MTSRNKPQRAGTIQLSRTQISAAVIASLVSAGALAAPIEQASVTLSTPQPTGTYTVQGGQTIHSLQNNTNAVEAAALDNEAQTNVGGGTNGSSVSVTANGVRVGARANAFSGSIALGVVDGSGAATGSAQFNTATISTLADDNNLGYFTQTLTDSSAKVNDNVISATTTVNAASQTLSGALPVNFGGYGAAHASYTTTPAAGAPASVAEGTLAVHSVQRARVSAAFSGEDASASARLEDNDIRLTVESLGAATTSSSPVLDNNSMSGTVVNNTATQLIDVKAGGAPTFFGSAVISNDQAASSTAGDVARVTEAHVHDSQIAATVRSNGGEGAVNTLTGAMSVKGNTLTAAATSNETVGATAGVAGNRIVLAEGVSFDGSGATGAQASVSYATGLDYRAQGSLAISNHQEAWTPVNSENYGSEISAQAQAVAGGSIALADNTVGSRAIGNLNTSAVEALGAATFTGSVALQNSQQTLNLPSGSSNEQARVHSDLDGAFITVETGFDGGVTHDAGVGVTGNKTSSSAYGNEAGQTVALTANTLNLLGSPVTALSSGASSNLHASATAALAITSLQSNQRAEVSAHAGDMTTGLSADSRGENTAVAGYNTILGSTLTVAGNTQEAMALGNAVANGVALTATTLGAATSDPAASAGSIGISSAQFQTGRVSADVDEGRVGLIAGTHVNGSTLAVADNLQRAVASGNQGGNSIAVTANAVNLGGVTDDGTPPSVVQYDRDASGGRVFDLSQQPVVNAAHGVLSNQVVSGSGSGVRASVGFSGTALAVEGDVTGSTATTTGNVVLAAGYGNDATNGVKLNVGSLTLNAVEGGFMPIANVSNTQAVGSAAAISAHAGGGEAIGTFVERNVLGSTVAASANAIEALAHGSRAVNSVSASGNAIAGGHGEAGGAGTSGDSELLAVGALSLVNAQSGQGSVSASLVSADEDAADSARVRVQVGRVANSNDVPQATLISGSTVRADDNLLLAQATSNAATNTVEGSANTLSATGALFNMQATSGSVSARVGVAGSPGTLPSSTTASATSESVSDSNVVVNTGADTLTVNAGTVTFEVTDSIMRGYLASFSGASVNGNSVTLGVGTYNMGQFGTQLSTQGSDGQIQIVASGANIPGTDPTPSAGGVTLAVTGGAAVIVAGSTLTVSGNTTSGLATGNSAVNQVSASGNSVASAGGADGMFSAASGFGGVLAAADHALANMQVVDGGAVNSNVTGTFAIDVTPPAGQTAILSGSTLAVDGNAQNARAVANTASNTLTLKANQLAASSALSSLQANEAAVSASSSLEMFVPAAVSQSAVSVSDNRNVALGVANDVANRVTVEGGARVASVVSSTAFGQGTGSNGVLVGDHVLANQQLSDGVAVNSTASTVLYNKDGLLATTPGQVSSSLTISGNSTVAEASANRASNALSAMDAASLAASVAVANSQLNTAYVSAFAEASAGLALNGGTGNAPALSGSNVVLNGNTTSSLARGNSAENVLNAAAGANYGGNGFGTAVLGSGDSGLFGNAAPALVLNHQANAGGVSAATLVNYRVSLNDTTAAQQAAAVSGSTVGVAGNVATAQAYGNSADNTLRLSALNTGVAAGGVSNTQSNSGAVVARVEDSVIGAQLGGGFTGAVNAGTVRVNGNQMGATAVGNSAVSSITAR